MSNAMIAVGDMERMAAAVAASKLFGMATPEQALALMLVAQAEGLHPATAARDYHIINGRPSLKADAMLARYLASGGKVEWHEHTDTKVAATFTHPAGGTLRIEWDMERAKKAELGGKGMWIKYPRQMLRARVISEGIRATNPGVSIGIYTTEEVQDMEPAPKQRKEKEINPLPAQFAPELADRTAVLTDLCEKAEMALVQVLAKAEVASAEEMSEEDFESACAMLKRIAIKNAKAAK